MKKRFQIQMLRTFTLTSKCSFNTISFHTDLKGLSAGTNCTSGITLVFQVSIRLTNEVLNTARKKYSNLNV